MKPPPASGLTASSALRTSGSVGAQVGKARTRRRAATSTSAFGSGRREAHDASAFYQRFKAPTLSMDDHVNEIEDVDHILLGDSRDMSVVPDDSVALVVTSPPYFAGKEYEEDLGANGVPSTYMEFLGLLHDVFSECARVLEPGGRIAVNVANLGRRPYRSLSADVTNILTDLGLLLRGEVIWWKGRAAGGSCAWGSFQSPANPVLRDVTERVVIASKGRFDRALPAAERRARGLPHQPTISREEFLEATTDLWELAPERASKVGHPAPFPIELPGRLIGLYTYAGDVVLDPFMGAGSTAVAALRAGRHYLGFEADAGYVENAERRLAAERASLHETNSEPLSRDGQAGQARGRAPGQAKVSALESGPVAAVEPGDQGLAVSIEAQVGAGSSSHISNFEQAIKRGARLHDAVIELLRECGFGDVASHVKVRGAGVTLDLVARAASGVEVAFGLSGALTVEPGGLRRADQLWKSLGQAAVVAVVRPELAQVLLSTSLPARGSAGAMALARVSESPGGLLGALDLFAPETWDRLRLIAAGDLEAGIGKPVAVRPKLETGQVNEPSTTVL